MRLRSLAALVVLAAGSPVHADPVLRWLRAAHLAPADQPGPGGAPAPAAPAAAPMLGDVTGEAQSMGLADLLQVAVRQAPALAQAKIDIELAQAEIQRSQAWADWALAAEVAGSTRDSGFGERVDGVNVSASVARALSTGGAVGLAAGGSWSRREFLFRDEDTGFSELITSTGYNESIVVTFAQPLLRGRGEAIVRAGERLAATQRDAAQIAQRSAAIAVVRDVVLGYLDLVAAERDLEIRRASLELAQERLRVTEAGIRGGGVAKAELIPVEQAIATREEEVMAGELVVLDSSLALRRRVQLPIERGQLLLASTGDLAIPARSWSQDQLIEAALASSPELAQLRASEAGATIEVEITENGMLPSLDLSLQVGPSGTADGPITAAKNMVQFDEFTAVGSLRLETTLDRTQAKANARAARGRRERVRVTAIDVRSQIVEAVTRAVAQVQVAERRYGIAVRAVALAEQNLEVEQARLALGKSRNVDVLMRQDELRAAQLRAVRTIIDWHRAATAIAALTGEILPQYGIEVK